MCPVPKKKKADQRQTIQDSKNKASEYNVEVFTLQKEAILRNDAINQLISKKTEFKNA